MFGIVLDGYLPPLLVAGFAGISIGVRTLVARRLGQRPRVAVDVAIIFAVITFTGLLELGMGRTPTYKYGSVSLWSGDVHSNQNSQQIADPYTFSHLIHGAAFYGLTHLALRSRPLGIRAIVAVAAESAWEALENTDMVIQRYRAETISLDYYGDSVLNSMFDIFASVLGFMLAGVLPVRMTVIWIVLIEVTLLFCIRDNLTLNIVMLLYPLASIKAWQAGG